MADILQGLIGIRDYFHQNVIFGAGILLVCGFFGGKLAQKLRLPAITGYIVIGLLLGPSVLSLVPDTVTVQLEPIPHIALGLIAISIGGRFSIKHIRKLGKAALIITALELGGAFVLVTAALLLCGAPVPMALVLGAIASATAPAATVAVISEYKARGPMTDTLLAVVALDDAGCILLFTLALAACRVLGNAGGAGLLLGSVLKPLWNLVGSTLSGLVVGYAMHRLVVNRRDRNEIIVIVLGFVLFCSAVTMDLHLSPLIANMVAGFVLINLSGRNERVFTMLEPVEAPMYAAFFALAGTELQLKLLGQIGLLGTTYVMARMLGKYLGASLGANLSQCSYAMRRYLGLCLVPQAGVAIGLALIARDDLFLRSAGYAVNIVTIVLATVVVNELIGPPIARYAIFRSGEVATRGTLGSPRDVTAEEETQT